MATTFTHAQRVERDAQVRAALDQGVGLIGLVETFGISKQAMWQFCEIRGWLEEAKANDARIRAAALAAKRAEEAVLTAARTKEREETSAVRRQAQAAALAAKEAARAAKEKAKADALAALEKVRAAKAKERAKAKAKAKADAAKKRAKAKRDLERARAKAEKLAAPKVTGKRVRKKIVKSGLDAQPELS